DKRTQISQLLKEIKNIKLDPQSINSGLEDYSTTTIKEKISVEKLLKRPQLGIFDIMNMDIDLHDNFLKYKREVLEQAEIQIKYDSYIEKEQQLVDKMNNMENFRIPIHFDYLIITALSAEGKHKLSKIKPET